jgi:hypothetical protein
LLGSGKGDLVVAREPAVLERKVLIGEAGSAGKALTLRNSWPRRLLGVALVADVVPVPLPGTVIYRDEPCSSMLPPRRTSGRNAGVDPWLRCERVEP